MKVCKTLFGRIKRPSQSCSRFARLGCEICLTLLDAKNSVRLSDVVPEIFSCSRLDRFFCLLFAAGIYINVNFNVYLFFGLNPGNGFSLPNSLYSKTVPDFSSSLPLSSAGFLSRFLFLLYLLQIQAVPLLSTFSFASPFPYVLRENQTAESVLPRILYGAFSRTFFARLACFTTERNDACIESMQFSAAVCFAYRRYAEICTVDCPIAGSLAF